VSIISTLFPPQNREAAAVAFLRTAWQVIRSTTLLGGAGLITISATSLMHLDVKLLAYTVAGILASALLSGALAAGDILVHGIPDAYAATAAATTSTTIQTSAAAVTPADPDQPAAGVPPTDAPADPGLPVVVQTAGTAPTAQS
jgi:hypothetical protein